jgi:hypothetical protein
MVTAAAGGLAAARGLYEKARPAIVHSKPGIAGIDGGLLDLRQQFGRR